MNRSLFVFLMLVCATPLFALDEGGDGPYIPSYRELVRQGYGSNGTYYQNGYQYGASYNKQVPKPTQAYHVNGMTIYYGYTPVPYRIGDTRTSYAFGYPVAYFNQMSPVNVTDPNLNRYSVAMSDPKKPMGSTDYIARNGGRNDAVTYVRGTKTSTKNIAANKRTTTTSKTVTASTGPKPATGTTAAASTTTTTTTTTTAAASPTPALPPIAEKPGQ